jgi:endonuclease/exonuclease/phosphatase family metal-dependent hydrolase
MNRLGRSKAAHQRAWEYLQHDVKADLALVQEAVPPDALTQSVYQAIGPAPYDWGSAVVAFRSGLSLDRYRRVPLSDSLFRGLGAHELPDSHPGAFAVADVLLDGKRLFTAVSLYAQWETLPGSKSLYGGPRLHRMLSDLNGVLARAKRRPVLVAGDFNVTSQGTRAADNEAAAVFTRLRAWGMAGCPLSPRPLEGCICPEGEGCRHVKTFRTGTQLDYAFASSTLSGGLRCMVWDKKEAWQLSDHCPIVLDMAEPEARS